MTQRSSNVVLIARRPRQYFLIGLGLAVLGAGLQIALWLTYAGCFLGYPAYYCIAIPEQPPFPRRTCRRTDPRSPAPHHRSGKRTRSSLRTSHRSGLRAPAQPHTTDTHPRRAVVSASIRRTGSRTCRSAAPASTPTYAVHSRHTSARGRPRLPRSRGQVVKEERPLAEVPRRDHEPWLRQGSHSRKTFWPMRGSSRSRCF